MSDDLGVVAFVLPGHPNRELQVEQVWDGAIVLTPVELRAAGDASRPGRPSDASAPSAPSAPSGSVAASAEPDQRRTA